MANSVVLFFIMLLILRAFTDYLDLNTLQSVVNAENQAKVAKHFVDTVLAYGISCLTTEDRHKFPWESSESSKHYHSVSSRNDTVVYVHVNFGLLVNGKDYFHLKTKNNNLYIKASSGTSALWGFNYYLKKYCKSQIGWQVENIKWPKLLPTVDESVTANDKFRYYQNVCTYSYSFVWWTEREWAKHIIWMALNGINLALAPLGHEIIWRDIYLEMGMTHEEVDEHFTGPAFLSWFRMGNIRGWGGPLSDHWNTKTKNLQLFLIKHMISLGMIPILPAFSGHVPNAFLRLFPNATFKKLNKWKEFDNNYWYSLFLDPHEPIFAELGKKYLKTIDETYGLYHIYNAEPFDEITNEWSTSFVIAVSRAIYQSMFEIDYRAVWLLQNWMFIDNPESWPLDKIKSFLTSLPLGRFLVLDLQSDQRPRYEQFDMYFGQPFIWCMLHNFGGNSEMAGSTESINGEVYRARNLKSSTMVGIGLTPEGINQNYVVYDLMLESAWRKNPVNLDIWVAEYAQRRYGCEDRLSRAWRYLIRSTYNFGKIYWIHKYSVSVLRPSLQYSPWVWYRSYDLIEAWKEFVMANCSTNAFFHDLTDVTKQALQYRANQLYMKIIDNLQFFWAYKQSMNQFLSILRDLELILYSHEDFSIRSWLGKKSESDLMNKINSRNLITLWGPHGEIFDYGTKEWGELFSFYFIPRWESFLKAYEHFLMDSKEFNESLVQETIKTMIERKFVSFEYFLIRPCTYNYSSTKEEAKKAFLKWYILPNVKDCRIVRDIKNQ